MFGLSDVEIEILSYVGIALIVCNLILPFVIIIYLPSISHKLSKIESKISNNNKNDLQ